MPKVSKIKRAKRRKRVWELRMMQYTQEEIAHKLGVSRSTVVADIKYLQQHPEEIPEIEDEKFIKWLKYKVMRLIEAGNLKDWQKVKAIVDLLKSQGLKKTPQEQVVKFQLWDEKEVKDDRTSADQPKDWETISSTQIPA